MSRLVIRVCMCWVCWFISISMCLCLMVVSGRVCRVLMKLDSMVNGVWILCEMLVMKFCFMVLECMCLVIFSDSIRCMFLLYLCMMMDSVFGLWLLFRIRGLVKCLVCR